MNEDKELKHILEALRDERGHSDTMLLLQALRKEHNIPVHNLAVAAIAIEAYETGILPKAVVREHLEAAPEKESWLNDDLREKLDQL